MKFPKKGLRLLVITFWIIFFTSVIGIPLLFVAVQTNFLGWFGDLPSLSQLERPDPDLSSELISADGVSLGKYFRKNRTPVEYSDLSSELINTLLVTEDIRFKKHSGIDLRAILRALVGQLTFQFKGGGSTLTMQLAENLYRTNTENQGSLYFIPGAGQLITKLKEWIIAVQLEKSYTKEEILAMYLNTVEFGSNSYGIKVAAKTFFNKTPSQLNYNESALLVGAINAPTRYNPILNPENALAKRTEVLYNLYKYGLIERKQFDSLKISSFGLNYRVESHNEGLATYFRTIARNYLIAWANENGYDLFEDGLRIYTTIDSKMQAYAEEAVSEHMDTLQSIFFKHLNGEDPWIDEEGKVIPDFIQNAVRRTDQYKYLIKQYGPTSDSVEILLNTPKRMRVFSWNGEIDTLFSTYDSLRYYKHFLQAGFMAMEPQTGHIKAWVGGINHKYFQYDHVSQGKRQPGSTLKPIVYTAAIENGFSPCQTATDAPVTFPFPGQDPPTWTPNNSTGSFSNEVMTLRRAMAMSVNSITAWIMSRIGAHTVVQYAQKLGIESKLDPVPSLCLGAGGDVSVIEMVGAYSTYVNKGIYTKPFFITRIEDQNGNTLQEFFPETKEAINEETAYIMLHMLKGTTSEPGGTALGLSSDIRYGNDVGAKTGTTQNASDGWFMGVTKDLAAGSWVGGDDRSIHFRTWTMGQGARTAMPIWQKFMLKVYSDKTLPYKKGTFNPPTQPLSVELDCTKYATNTPSFDSNPDDIF